VRWGVFFGQITKEVPGRGSRPISYRRGDYVFCLTWNFLNLFNEDPKDTGIAGIDIYKMDPTERHRAWTPCSSSVLENSAPGFAPNVPRAILTHV